MDSLFMRNGINYVMAICCLQRYQELHGDMLVPQRFVVPDQSDLWPQETWRMQLGGLVHDIRKGHTFKCPKQREELLSMGFNFNHQKNRHKFPAIKTALILYNKIHGDLHIPQKFTVPSDSDDWPEEFWHMKLGSIASDIRSGSYKGMKEELISIGFDFSFKNRVPSYALFKSAFMQYKAIHGDIAIIRKFTVPCENDSWTPDTWGLALGTIAECIRNGERYKDKRGDLESIGFDFGPRRVTYGFDAVLSALSRYKDLKGNMLVPAHFVVPDQCSIWPTESWAMKLGRVAQDIRGGRCYKNKIAELTLLGFEFAPLNKARIDYNLLKPALVLYKEKNNDFSVEAKFKVPADESWPEDLWRFELGSAVRGIRRGSSSMKSKIRQELVDIGFEFKKSIDVYDKVKVAVTKFREKNSKTALIAESEDFPTVSRNTLKT